MRIIRDNLYLFSVARSNSGEIVACRAEDHDGAVGKHIYDILEIDKADLNYAVNQRNDESYRSICLSCRHEGKKKAVAFFNFLAFSSSLCLAVVFDLEISSAARALESLGYSAADLSPTLKKMAQEPTASLDGDMLAYTYVSQVFGTIVPLGALRASPFPDNPEALRRYIDCVADLVWIDVSYATERSLEGLGEDGVIFSGGFFAAALITVAMLARRYSKDRRLDAFAIQGRGVLSLTLQFETDDENCFEGLKFLSEIASSYGIYFERTLEGGRASLVMMPVYADVGLAEVKERDDYPLYSTFCEPEE